MTDSLIDALIDTLKLLPYLYVTFLIIELMEERLTARSRELISRAERFGPLVGSLVGLLPQCGFSVMATNLFITRIISLGTLMAIYLATSDEMLPIMISNRAALSQILPLLLIKLVTGLLAGTLINLIIPHQKTQQHDYTLCEDDDCECEEHGPFLAALKHTVNIALFILVITALLNVTVFLHGESFLEKILLVNEPVSPLLATIIGLIPNCGSSVILTQLYLSGAISLPMAASGLLANSGVALLVLFRNNHHRRQENLLIIGLLSAISSLVGWIIMLIQ